MIQSNILDMYRVFPFKLEIYMKKSFKIFSPRFLCPCLNSLLPVSRYIDTAFADKGSHQKKNLQPKCLDTSKFGLLGKPTKKLEWNPLFQSIFEASKFQKLKKSCLFLFWKNIFLTPPPLNCFYLRPSISVFTNFFFAESVMDSSIILK